MKPSNIRQFITVPSVALLVLGTSACATSSAKLPPPPLPATVPEEAPRPKPLNFTPVGKDPIADRSEVTAQRALEEANRIWFARSTDRADYLRAARLLMAAIEDGAYSTAEEELRLSTITLQHALLADDVEVLRGALLHWEHGYGALRNAPNPGEVETYLLAARRVGLPLSAELVAIAHPEIQIVLGQDK